MTIKIYIVELRQLNNFLKIADRHSLDTVNEYLNDELADNNDDVVKFRDADNRPSSFGLSSAEYILTKVVWVLVKYWRSRVIPVIVNLDNDCVCDTFPKVKYAQDSLQYTLYTKIMFCFKVWKVASWAYTQSIMWFAFLWSL